ncbi:MAG TPA: competence type IV pilus minor pilin ComGG [Bacillales bacterium]|nr:competence type IV pilus minor pilin ComGG [Bacillales bacterium]
MKERFFRLRRMHKEGGFVLPLTLVVLFLVSAFLLHEIKLYETEKRFLHASEEMFTLDRLLQMADVDLERNLSRSASSRNLGILLYKNGKVRYSVEPFSTNVVRITLKAKTNDGGKHISHAYYDKIKKKIIRWEEDV